ncbi:MAG TPA: serine hydrolase domain-containing protein [Candidatus Binataceae bacterium]|nr:serine hydrolase domain-containing protein [Candidatus Binataceae bacterium]
MNWTRVEQAFNDAIERGVMPGATVVVRKGPDVVFEGGFGWRQNVPERHPMQLETVFDLSSLTKALATSVAIMMLIREGKVRLDDRVTRYFHNFGVHGKTYITFRHLLGHYSGLAGWRPYYEQIVQIERNGRVNFMASRGAKEYVYEQIHREKLEAPAATRAIYSDLNFMLLGEVVEQITGLGLHRFCRDRIFRPLGLRATDFVDISLVRSRRLEPVPEMFAATEVCPSRKRLLVGEVHDENAYAMGGVAGHAGLFGPAKEVDRIAAELIACYHGRSDLVPRPIIAEFWKRNGVVNGSTWALGWDTPTAGQSSAGSHFSPAAVGHLGFTGTSIWIEPEREIAVTILTNRVHPRRDNEAIRDFRPLIHDRIMEVLNGSD